MKDINRTSQFRGSNRSQPRNGDDIDGVDVDITSLMESAASCLTYTNPFIARSSFNLYDSMSALDLTEPKMDGCEVPIGYYRNKGFPSQAQNDVKNNNTSTSGGDKERSHVPPRPIPESIQKSTLLWKHQDDLTARNVRTILIEMLVRLDSLLQGNSISESIYTCLYLHNSILKDMQQHIYIHEQRHLMDLEEAEQVKVGDQCTDYDSPDRNPYYSHQYIMQKTIYTASILLVKLSEVIVRIVERADIYEEEDFNIERKHFDFFKNGYENGGGVVIDVESALGDVKKIKYGLKIMKERDDLGDDDGNLQVIVNVLDYLTNLLEVCDALTSLNKDTVVEVQNIQDRIFSDLKGMQEFVPLVQSQSNSVTLKKHKSKSNLPSDETRKNEFYTSEDKHTIFCTFDPYINRHLFGNTPVRSVTFPEPPVAIRNLIRIYQEMSWSVCDLILKGDSLGRIHRMMYKLSDPNHHNGHVDGLGVVSNGDNIGTNNSTKEGPAKLNILTRSLVLINLYFDDRLFGQHPLTVLISQDMQRYGVPAALFTYNNPNTEDDSDLSSLQSQIGSEYGIEFLGRLCKPTYDVLKLTLLNRNRQQTYMDAVMFKDWNKLRNSASTVDMCFQTQHSLDAKTTMPFVSNYVLFQTVRLMEHHTALGIELGLFHGHYHLLTAFWYRDYLMNTELKLVTAMREHVKERRAMELQIEREEELERKRIEMQIQQQKVKMDKKKKGGGKKKKGKQKGRKYESRTSVSSAAKKDSKPLENHVPTTTAEDNEEFVDDLLIRAKQLLCRGVVRFLAALNQAEILEKPNYRFSSHEVCFHKRFQSFHQITQPPPLTYDDFKKGTESTSVSHHTLISSSMACFKECRSLLEKINSDSDRLQIKDAYRCVNKKDAVMLVKVCVGNSLYLLKLLQAVTKDGGESESKAGKVETSTKNKPCKVSFDFQSNTQFCSISLKL